MNRFDDAMDMQLRFLSKFISKFSFDYHDAVEEPYSNEKAYVSDYKIVINKSQYHSLENG